VPGTHKAVDMLWRIYMKWMQQIQIRIEWVVWLGVGIPLPRFGDCLFLGFMLIRV